MKVFFGDDLQSMISELRSQDAKMIRLHVLHKFEGDVLTLESYVTCLCNRQLYESVTVEHLGCAEVPQEERGDLAAQKRQETWSRMAEKFEMYEVKRGVFQE